MREIVDIFWPATPENMKVFEMAEVGDTIELVKLPAGAVLESVFDQSKSTLGYFHIATYSRQIEGNYTDDADHSQ